MAITRIGQTGYVYGEYKGHSYRLSPNGQHKLPKGLTDLLCWEDYTKLSCGYPPERRAEFVEFYIDILESGGVLNRVEMEKVAVRPLFSFPLS